VRANRKAIRLRFGEMFDYRLSEMISVQLKCMCPQKVFEISKLRKSQVRVDSGVKLRLFGV
jgi:hypothetical protein